MARRLAVMLSIGATVGVRVVKKPLEGEVEMHYGEESDLGGDIGDALEAVADDVQDVNLEEVDEEEVDEQVSCCNPGEILILVNKERSSRGIANLSMSSKLNRAARGHSIDMANRNYVGHDSPEGENPDARAKKAGCCCGAAECIARGQRRAEGLVQSWMNSAGHKAILLDRALKVAGFGSAANSEGRLVHTWKSSRAC